MENQNIEYKQSWSDKYLEYVSSFSNAQGGELYIGLDDNGNPVGLSNIKKLMEEIPQKIKSHFDLVLPVNQIIIKDVQVIQIVIPPELKGVSYQGKYYMRSGSTSLILNGAALTSFMLRINHIYYEDLESDNQNLTFNEFIKICKDISFPLDDRKFLTLGIKNSEGKFTNLGKLLSDQNTYFIKFALFKGNTRDEFVVKKELENASLFTLINNTLEICEYYNFKSAKIINGQVRRQEIKSYPDPSLREAVLNAFAHNDYLSTTNIKIEIFIDRCTITSAGGLYNGISLENALNGIQASRNPKIVNLLARLDYMENYASGLFRIVKIYKEYNLTPFFDCSPGFFRITLPNVNYQILKDSSADPNLILNEKTETVPGETDVIASNDLERKVILLIKQNNKILRSEIASLLSVSTKTIERVINNSKTIARIGGPRGFWKIIE